MIQLIYVSEAARAYTSTELIGILNAARRNNTRNGITGMLTYENRVFMQVLEGDAKLVEETFERISADQRHTHCRVVEKKAITTRQYGEWSMSFADITGVCREVDGYVSPGLIDLQTPAAEQDEDAQKAGRLLKLLRNSFGQRPAA